MTAGSTADAALELDKMARDAFRLGTGRLSFAI
jgi:hypothetical protein